MNKELIDILRPAYEPCDGLNFSCKDIAIWKPSIGHIPRGFCGAYGSIQDIELVLVLAEPGDPGSEESYPENDPEEIISTHNQYVTFTGGSLFHKNTRKIISLCYPNTPLEYALKKTWITESVLCSTPATQTSTGRIPTCVIDECSSRYLLKQHQLIKDAFWVAVGAKARRRLNRAGIKYHFEISHPAPPEGNKKRAHISWENLAEKFESFRNARRNET